jgi:hypothetical protein
VINARELERTKDLPHKKEDKIIISGLTSYYLVSQARFPNQKEKKKQGNG